MKETVYYITPTNCHSWVLITLATDLRGWYNYPGCSKVVGVLRELQIKTMIGYNDSWSSRTLIGRSNFICIFSCPVIGQGARDEMNAAFTTIVTVANLYVYFLYPQNTTTAMYFETEKNISRFLKSKDEVALFFIYRNL